MLFQDEFEICRALKNFRKYGEYPHGWEDSCKTEILDMILARSTDDRDLPNDVLRVVESML